MTETLAAERPLRDEIFERMDELTPAERKVARTLLARYPAAGLESTAALAAAAGTSKPTVLRLLARLGFGSYPEFQERLRDCRLGHVVNAGSRPVPRAENIIGELWATTTRPSPPTATTPPVAPRCVSSVSKVARTASARPAPA